jgi:hypothetical protein
LRLYRSVPFTLDGAEQTMWASWVVVAEGSHSTLRAKLGIPWTSTHFPGALLQVDAFVDGQMPGSPADAHLFLDLGGTFGSLPLPDGRRRLFLSVPDRNPGVQDDPPIAEIEPLVRAFLRQPSVRLVGGQFNWRVRFHNSISETFQAGRCLLIGDSARTFMPVAAQGMNTGIQDAFNLGWKLAAVVRGRAGETLLSSYAAERHPVAVDALNRVEKGLWSGVGEPPPLEEVIEGIHRQRTTRTALALSYKAGPLAKDTLGTRDPMAGDRAPEVLAVDGSRATALYPRLRHGSWTLLVFPPGPEPHSDPRLGPEIPIASRIGEAARAYPDSLRVLLMGEARVPAHVNAERFADPGGSGPCRLRSQRRRVVPGAARRPYRLPWRTGRGPGSHPVPAARRRLTRPSHRLTACRAAWRLPGSAIAAEDDLVADEPVLEADKQRQLPSGLPLGHLAVGVGDDLAGQAVTEFLGTGAVGAVNVPGHDASSGPLFPCLVPYDCRRLLARE